MLNSSLASRGHSKTVHAANIDAAAMKYCNFFESEKRRVRSSVGDIDIAPPCRND